MPKSLIADPSFAADALHGSDPTKQNGRPAGLPAQLSVAEGVPKGNTKSNMLVKPPKNVNGAIVMQIDFVTPQPWNRKLCCY